MKQLFKIFEEWQCDPFNLNNQVLRTLQASMMATNDLTKDFVTAHNRGEELVS